MSEEIPETILVLPSGKKGRIFCQKVPGEQFESEGIKYTYDDEGRLYVDAKQVSEILLEDKELKIDRETISSIGCNENLQKSKRLGKIRSRRITEYYKRRQIKK